VTPWKKTFYSAFVAQILSIVGFSFVLPFLPFYVEELGVADPGAQRIWSGIVLSAAGWTLALFAPIWGVLADRYGRKAMVVRSMLGGTVVLALMAFVQTPLQLAVCRVLQGALTGTVAASVALVASVSPSRKSGYTLGMMQMAVFLGVSLGPMFGGLVADHFGYRPAFLAGAGVILLGGLLVLYGTREEFTRLDPSDETTRGSYRRVLMMGGFLAAVLVMFTVRLSNTMSSPAFPLVVEEIRGSKANLNTLTGSIIMCAGLAAAVSAGVLGHVGDRWGHKRVLIVASLLAAVAVSAHALARSVAELYVVRTLFGLAVAGMMPAANAIVKRITPSHNIGRAFGAATSFSTLGLAIGPLLGGYLAARYALQMPFLVSGACLLVVCGVVAVAIREPSADGVDGPGAGE